MTLNRALPQKNRNIHYLDYSKEKDIVEYGVVQKVLKTGEGDEDFIVVEELIETSRVNRQDAINAYRDDRDIYKVIDRVNDGADVALLHQGDEGIYIDTTKLPRTIQEYDNMLKKASSAYDGLPDDLKKNMSLAQFVDSFKDDDLSAYFNAKQQVVTEEKGGVK